jgi:hypothetical protein
VTDRPDHLLFVPGGGGAGSGESFRSLMLAHGARDRWPDLRIGFLTGTEHRDVGFEAFERHTVPGRVSRNHAGVLEILQSTRPRVVIFDNRGSTAAVAGAARLGAKVVYIADSPQILRRVLRLRRLRRLDQLWLVQRRLGPTQPGLSWLERRRLDLARVPEVHSFDALFPEPDAESRAKLLSELGLDAGPYALFVAGGGGTVHAGRPAPEIFAEAAGRVHQRTGLACATVLGPLYAGHPRRQTGVTLIPSLAPARMIELLSAAKVVACGGGVTSVQALALGRLCVAADTGGADQPGRLEAFERAGLLRSVPLEASALAEATALVLHDPQVGERMRIALASMGLRNGLPRALDALGALLGRS